MPNYSHPGRKSKFCQTDEEACLINLTAAFSVSDTFVVDIGAGDGVNLSNSRLLMDIGWDAFRVDGAYSDPAAKLHQAFVTSETIAALLREHNVPRAFGILTIDIDGIDLYVLNAVLGAGYRPQIICFEFNACRKPDSHDVVVYQPDFKIAGDYYGASWGAFKHVLDLHRYTCVHHSGNLNGYAVDRALSPVPSETSPSYQQYHPHNPHGIWEDARKLFVPGVFLEDDEPTSDGAPEDSQ